MSLNKIFDALKVLIGSAFLIFQIFNFDPGVDQNLIIMALNAIFVVLATIFGGNALIRMLQKQHLSEVPRTHYMPYITADSKLIPFERWEDVIKIVVGTAYAIFAIFGFSPGIDQGAVLEFISYVFAAIAAIIAVFAGLRVHSGFYLVKQKDY